MRRALLLVGLTSVVLTLAAVGYVKDTEPWFSAVRLIDSLIFRLSDGDWSDHDKVAKDCP